MEKQRNLQAENKQLDDTYKADLLRLTQQTEAMRMQKDEEIKTQHQTSEKMRSEYEIHIDELKVTLNKYQQ